MSNIDLLAIVRAALVDIGPPVYVEDNRYPRRIPTDPIEMVATSPPAYVVLVTVNGSPGYLGPWVSVTHTGRFGFTPGPDLNHQMDGYTYLTPPDGLDQEDHERPVESCWMCQLDDDEWWWQVGCPTTDLPVAPVFTRDPTRHAR